MPRLRALVERDEDLIRGWRNLPEVSSYMYSDHTISEAEHARWFSSVWEDETRWYRIIELDDEPVGLASISQIDHEAKRCSWAFYLASDTVRGRGVGSWVEYQVIQTALEDWGLNKLCCEVLVSNAAVIRMHESFGFRREALLREHVWKQGTALDVVALALLRSEWDTLRTGIRERLILRGVLTEDC